METTGIGGGILLAVAAGLWMLYLIPSWLRRRTMSDVDRAEQRAEQRADRAARLADRVAQARDLAQAGVVAQASVSMPARSSTVTSRAYRRRRARLLASLALLVSLVAIVVQVSLVITSGAVAGSVLVLGAGAFVGISALAALRRLADVSNARRTVAVRQRRTQLSMQHVAPVASPSPWTPVPLPQPLYLSRAVAPPVVATDAIAELQAAAAFAERALRFAQTSPEVLPLSRPTASRFAGMGIIDPGVTEQTDLDAVLKRRRAAG